MDRRKTRLLIFDWILFSIIVSATGCSTAPFVRGNISTEEMVQEEIHQEHIAEEAVTEEKATEEASEEDKVTEKEIVEKEIVEIVEKEIAEKSEYGNAAAVPNRGTIKIALIDTGITKSAINSEHVLPGWNYCRDSEATEDTIGHGTSLAGMILGSDKANIPGGMPDAYIVPLVCQEEDSEGNINKAEPEMLAQMILDAVSVYECNIISISAGVKQDYDVLREAVEYAEEMGVLVIAAAGNEGNQDIYYPGGYESVLCVGSANREMTGRADFSQDNEMVDLLAPGENIVVTTMKGNPMEVSGTSYSVAYITAVAARLWQQNPKNSSHQIAEQLMEHTVLVGEDHLLSLV